MNKAQKEKVCLYSWFPCTNFIKIMPNLNTAKLQTHNSFGENFVLTYVQKSTKWHSPLCCAYNLRIKKKSRSGTRACVALCCHVFAWNIFHESARQVIKCTQTKCGAAGRAPGVSLRGLFCFNFEAPCRILILIILLIRENWALNFGKMKDPSV